MHFPAAVGLSTGGTPLEAQEAALGRAKADALAFVSAQEREFQERYLGAKGEAGVAVALGRELAHAIVAYFDTALVGEARLEGEGEGEGGGGRAGMGEEEEEQQEALWARLEGICAAFSELEQREQVQQQGEGASATGAEGGAARQMEVEEQGAIQGPGGESTGMEEG